MKRYGTNIKGGNSGMNVGYDSWNAYDLNDKAKERHRLYRSRARATNKKK